MEDVDLMAICEGHVALEESAAAHFVEMLRIGGAVSGYVVVSVMVIDDVVMAGVFVVVGDGVVVMVNVSAAAGLLVGVSGFAAASQVAMMEGHLFEGMGCIAAAADFVVFVFDTCLFWHARQHGVCLKFDVQFVVYVYFGLVD